MNDQARQHLRSVLKQYGSSVCNTPRSFEMMLRSGCMDCPNEIKALMLVLERGIVTDLTKMHEIESWEAVSTPMVNQLTEQAGMNAEDARWAVDSWGMALRKHPDTAPAPGSRPKQPDRPLYPDDEKKAVGAAGNIKNTITVAFGGGLGGGLGGGSFSIITLGLLSVFADLLPDDMKREKETVQAFSMIWSIIFTLVGIFAGALGGGLAWLVVIGQSAADVMDAQTTAKWVLRSFMGALSGAFLATVILPNFCGGFGVLLGALFGSFGGAYTASLRS